MPAPFREPIDLETATALDGANGNYAIELNDAWRLWGPSGGYLSAIALRAAGEVAALDRPVSFYCHFVRAPAFGLAEVNARLLRPGRRSESIAVELHQDGKLMLTALVRTAAPADGFDHQIGEAPDVPAPTDVAEFRWNGEGADDYTYWNNFERRATSGRWGVDGDLPIQREWLRSLPIARFENPFVDAARPLMALDTYGYIAANRKYFNERFVSPNLDTSAWFHDIGAQTDWLLIDHASPVAREGLIAVDGRVWSEDGVLVASGAAQLIQISG
ncbi:MAG: thioesterase family protein [Solirubrobacterales bacterium]